MNFSWGQSERSGFFFFLGSADDELALFLDPPMMSWLRLSNEAARQGRGEGGEGLRVTPAASALTALPCSFLLSCYRCFFFAAARTQQLTRIPNPLLCFFSFLELLWGTVGTVGFGQEGREPHEEPIREHHRMCVSDGNPWVSVCVVRSPGWISALDNSKLLKHSFIISQQKQLWPLQLYFSIHLPAVSFQLCKNKSCLHMAAPLGNLFCFVLFFVFFVKQKRFYFPIRWSIIWFTGQPFYSCWKTYI